MKSFRLLFDICLIYFLYFFSSCSEEPIYTDLSNVDNNIDTLLITDISGYNYQISPNIGGYNKLYVGSREEFTFLSIITIPLVGSIILSESSFNSWRHLYFIYPCLIYFFLKCIVGDDGFTPHYS